MHGEASAPKPTAKGGEPAKADVSSVFQSAAKGGGSGSAKGSGAMPALDALTGKPADASSSAGSSWVVIGLVVLFGSAAVLIVLRQRRGGQALVSDVTSATAGGDGKRRAKTCVITDANGRDHTASLSLDCLAQVDEVREAITELAADVLEDDTLLSHDLEIELRDEIGRRKALEDHMSLSAVLRASSLRAKLKNASRVHHKSEFD